MKRQYQISMGQLSVLVMGTTAAFAILGVLVGVAIRVAKFVVEL